MGDLARAIIGGGWWVLVPGLALGAPYRLTGGEGSGLPTWAEVHDALHALHRRHPEHTEPLLLGHSAEGRPLWGLRVSSDPTDRNRPAILLTAAHHPDEAATPLHVLDAAREMLSQGSRPPFADWLERMTLVIVPMVNPDGSHIFWEIDRRRGRKSGAPFVDDRGRVMKTARGVDLNRNYPFLWDGPSGRFTSNDPHSRFYRGPAPGSEPEVRAMMALADRERFVGALSYHSSATRLIVPGPRSVPGQLRRPLPWVVARSILDHLPHAFGRRGRRYAATGGLYPVTGVEKDWHHHTFGTLAYVLELPYRRPTGARLAESIQKSRGAWQALFARFVEGPSLSLRVTDRMGQPLAVQVDLDVVDDVPGRPRTTDPDTGWFHSYLPEVGMVTAHLRHRGRTWSVRGSVGPGVTRWQTTWPGSSVVVAGR